MDALTRMRCFIQVVDSKGFSAAAREMGKSKALVSKYIGELEDELGARLLNRTTRQVSLTEVGEAYYKETTEILQRIDDLNVSVQSSQQDIKGRLKVSAPRSMGDGFINQAIMEFLSEYPDVVMDLRLDDRFVDLVDEGFDVAIRVSEMTDSSLIARKVAPFKAVIVTTPEALEKFGRPKQPTDLASLPCIIDTNYRFKQNWNFFDSGKKITVSVHGPLQVNSASAGRDAALLGLGFLRTPIFFVADDLETGRLVTVLDDYAEEDSGIFAVYPHRRHLASKVRAFVDFLAAWFAKKKNDPHQKCPL